LGGHGVFFEGMARFEPLPSMRLKLKNTPSQKNHYGGERVLLCSVFFLFFSAPRIFAIFPNLVKVPKLFLARGAIVHTRKRAKKFLRAGCDCAHTKKCQNFFSRRVRFFFLHPEFFEK
jgi:hypothetical protein